MNRLILLLCCLVPMAAFAESEPTPSAPAQWEILSYTGDVQLRGKTPLSNESYTYLGLAILFEPADTPGLAISCSARHGLSVSFATDTIGLGKVMEGGKGRIRPFRVQFGEGEELRSKALVQSRAKTYHPVRSSIAKKAFNAAILGETITIRIQGGTYITYTLPPINDAFRQFTNACGVTNPNPDAA